jgi:hypothetical protein
MFSKGFKKAIEELPSTEKTSWYSDFKKKDLDLANRLHFELVATETVDEKRNDFERAK